MRCRLLPTATKHVWRQARLFGPLKTGAKLHVHPHHLDGVLPGGGRSCVGSTTARALALAARSRGAIGETSRPPPGSGEILGWGFENLSARKSSFLGGVFFAHVGDTIITRPVSIVLVGDVLLFSALAQKSRAALLSPRLPHNSPSPANIHPSVCSAPICGSVSGSSSCFVIDFPRGYPKCLPYPLATKS